MATMTDMGCGMPSEHDILVKTRRFLVYAVTLGSIMITFNSCGFNKSIFKKYIKNDHEVKNRDHKNDGLFNKLFPPYAGNDAQTIRQDFNLLKQVMPNGENMARLCMIGYTRSNYGNLYCLFELIVAHLSDKEAEYIIDKETTRKLIPRNEIYSNISRLYWMTFQVNYSILFISIFHIHVMIHLPLSLFVFWELFFLWPGIC